MISPRKAMLCLQVVCCWLALALPLWGQAPSPASPPAPAAPAEQPAPVLQFLIAAAAIGLILTIVLMPARKNR